MVKAQEFNMEEFLRNNLQSRLREELGRKTIEEQTNLPEYLGTSLNPSMPLRPYQELAFKYFLNYWDNDFDGKPLKPHLLFHMATGSGKTLIMAGLILYLYTKGYRNFLFFVGSSNVVGKTEDNFFNPASPKYQFVSSINIDGKQVEIRRVDNFQGANENCINFCLTTTQGLHSDLNTPKEGGVSYNDFSSKGLVLISDEAHHMNSAAKKGIDVAEQLNLFNADDFEPSDDWETTVMRIFHRTPEDGKPNVLLEFTATEDFAAPNIADKYADKIIFDYPLKKFREDGYSKDIAVVQSDTAPIERAIQAIILSQYRRKLFASIKQDIKPVVMFKSKKIVENKKFHDEFIDAVKNLTIDTLQRICSHANNDILSAFSYFEEKGITYENLLLELQEDFKDDNLLLIDGNNITPEKQAYLNSLEAKDNEFRAVFAVDMLNEGWDVLNLYDIVRLYDTRDANSNKPGKTTNAEAQLIGRGARYMPFSMPKTTLNEQTATNDTKQEAIVTNDIGNNNIDTSVPVGARKFDNDLCNRLRALETLHYHSSHNPKYVQELNTALTNSGIIAPRSREVSEKLKESFKKTKLYTEGYVFANEQERYVLNEEVTNIGTTILNREYSVRVKSGDMEQSSVFSKATAQDAATLQQKLTSLGDFSNHIIRAAINRLPELAFCSLLGYFPNLKSVKEFIESEAYLSKIRVKIIGQQDAINNLSPKEQLNVVIEVLRQIVPLLAKGGIGTRGTKEFKGRMVRDVFKDHSFKVSDGTENKEEGKSIKTTTNMLLRFDVDNAEWYAYNDNFGTEEEKYLIKYIESIMGKLQEKYGDIYLVRNNEKDLKIYDFESGKATEPDFVLFMRRKNKTGVYDNIQIFIEPKGLHLRGTDAWKAEFEKRIHIDGYIHFHTQNQNFEIWGMPFYTEDVKKEFDDAMKDNFEI